MSMDRDLEDDIFRGLDESNPPAADTSVPADVPVVDDRRTESRMMSEAIRGLIPTPSKSDAPQAGQPGQAPAQTAPAETLEQMVERLKTENANITRERDGVLADLRKTRQRQPEGQPQTPAQQKAPLADRLFSNTEEAVQEIFQTFDERLARQAIKFDMALTLRDEPELLPKAFQAFYEAVGNPEKPDPHTYARIMEAPSQARAILDWYRERETLNQVGPDPVSFQEKAIADHMARLGLNPDGTPLAQGAPAPAAAQGAAPGRQPNGQFAPRSEVRLPSAPSRLAGASNSGAQGMVEDGSEEAIYDAARGRK